MPPKSRKRTTEELHDDTKAPTAKSDDASELITRFIESREANYDSFTNQVSKSDKLEPLDEWRNSFPSELKERYGAQSEDLYITLDELKKLMDWKLQKGKFRPTLPKLIAQNSEESVVSASKLGFSQLLAFKKDDSRDAYLKIVKTATQSLCVLRGVGPATASLILSLLSEITYTAPPFFSDEAAEFVFEKMYDVHKLKYSIAEYMKYVGWWYDLVGPEFRESMTKLEQGAWCERLIDNGFKSEVKGVKKQKKKED